MNTKQLRDMIEDTYSKFPINEAEIRVAKLLEQYCNRFIITFPVPSYTSSHILLHMYCDCCPREFNYSCDDCDYLVAYEKQEEFCPSTTTAVYCLKEDDANGEEAKAERYFVSENPEIPDDYEGADQRPTV